jgi:hypothetical protein
MIHTILGARPTIQCFARTGLVGHGPHPTEGRRGHIMPFAYIMPYGYHDLWARPRAYLEGSCIIKHNKIKAGIKISMKCRLYVYEVGNSDLGSSSNPNHRYLSLTGVIFELDYVKNTVFPAVEGIKNKYFNSHPDEPIILHRKEIVNKKSPFDSLMDPKVEISFNNDLIKLLTNLNYLVITVVIDKSEHKSRYQVWRFDPYHYCLTILVERYVRWLQENNSVGDVMAESRGGKIASILEESKLLRSPSGQINGWGRKWLP